MVMYARKQQRLSDGCHDRRGDSQPYQALKYSSKSHPGGGDHRHDKMRDTTDPSPPNKMLRRSDSPENKYGDNTGHSKAKSVHAHRVRERDGGTSYSPQENSHNHSALHSSNSHSSNPSNNPSKTSDAAYDSADDWSEHISSSGKKYYYNCRTEVSQWEKPKEWLEREQRQKEASKMSVNSFPKDRDYRREVMQATAASGFASGMEDKHSSDASSMLPQNILSQTSRHNDRDYRLPRAETHSSSTPVQHPIKPVVHPTATPSTVPPSPFSLQSDHQPKKSFDANGASTLSKLPTSTSSIPAQKTERKASPSAAAGDPSPRARVPAEAVPAQRCLHLAAAHVLGERQAGVTGAVGLRCRERAAGHFCRLSRSGFITDEQFLGFGSDEEVKVRSPTRSPTGTFKSRDWTLILYSPL
ncbi:PREDICTED: WW domain-containing adapter protein with coiled-coil-like [Nipponia nippon]|uniref:WW domain-containing adapter protein with coiled-coil-like n=1 Tax=Nipponia nippon TaxID=128390 RepID=UPI00051171BB|nr:PREDICTED: WW domain-containing adapter protein with coiled-coil-like [Nipponia nippon]